MVPTIVGPLSLEVAANSCVTDGGYGGSDARAGDGSSSTAADGKFLRLHSMSQARSSHTLPAHTLSGLLQLDSSLVWTPRTRERKWIRPLCIWLPDEEDQRHPDSCHRKSAIQAYQAGFQRSMKGAVHWLERTVSCFQFSSNTASCLMALAPLGMVAASPTSSLSRNLLETTVLLVDL